MSKRRFNAEQDVEIIRRYQAGESSITLARTFGGSPLTIRAVLRRNGVKLRPRAGLDVALRRHAGEKGNQRVLASEQEQIVIRHYIDGKSTRVIAKLINVDAATIRNTLRRYDIKRRPAVRYRTRTPESRALLVAAWITVPANRLRKLLYTAKSGSRRRSRAFDNALFDMFHPAPKNCACCGIEFDYAVRSRKASGRSR